MRYYSMQRPVGPGMAWAARGCVNEAASRDMDCYRDCNRISHWSR